MAFENQFDQEPIEDRNRDPRWKKLTTSQMESGILFASDVPISSPIKYPTGIRLGGFGWNENVGLIIDSSLSGEDQRGPGDQTD